MTERAREIADVLMQSADSERAQQMLRFFKTGKGQYGEGDIFLGLGNPQVRMLVKETWKDTALADAADLVRSKYHEVRLTGLLIMVELFGQARKKRDNVRMKEIFKVYVSLHKHINNWDLVDLSAPKIVGYYEMLFPEDGLMDQWIQPDHTIWQQRISMVACWQHVRYHHYGQLISRAETLLSTKEDLLQKASGWMLREMDKHDEAGHEALLGFLETHVQQMPSTMLSYAIERYPSDERTYWRQRRRN